MRDGTCMYVSPIMIHTTTDDDVSPIMIHTTTDDDVLTVTQPTVYRTMGKALLFTAAILAVLMCAQCQTEIPYPRFEFMGEPLPNNSYINRGGIYEGSDALMCVTDYAACCSDPLIGEWYDFEGMQVHQGLDSATTLYVTRGVGVVRLHRITGGRSALWRCDIPNSDGDLQSLYIFTGIDYTG